MREFIGFIEAKWLRGLSSSSSLSFPMSGGSFILVDFGVRRELVAA